MKISLVMMLKNEARTVSGAISSLISIVDEVVIGIDNTTTDDTLQQCKNAIGNKYHTVHHFDFKDDFSAIRNELITKANHEWIFTLDGHEYFAPECIPILNQLKDNIPAGIQIFDFNIYDNSQNVVFQQPRLFRSEIQYELPIHNVIAQIKNRLSVPQISIIHKQPDGRYKERKAQRVKMNIPGLNEKAKKGDARSMYYLADAFHELGDYDNAEKWYRKYLPKSDFPHEKYEAKIRLAQIATRKKDKQQIVEWLMDCFTDKVGLNEHLMLLGQFYYEELDYDQAVYFFRLATTVKLPNRFLMLNPNYYSWFPWYSLALAYVQLNDVDGLRECINKGKIIAPERQEFIELEEKMEQRFKVAGLKKKGKIYFVASLPHFIEPYVNAVRDDYYIRFDYKFNPDNASNADLIFCEWGDYNAVAVSHYQCKAKKILRIHAYEVFNDNFIDQINWYGIDEIIFVSNHIKDFWQNKVNAFDVELKTTVLRNGVDLGQFILQDKKINNNIAWVGYITNKKGAILLLALANSNNAYQFDVCGQFQEPDIQQLFEQNIPSNMSLHQWKNHTMLNAFFQDKSYILNTSPREGCPVSILQGMACGLKPIIYDWIGADQMFPGYVYSTFSQFSNLLGGTWEPKKYREKIEKGYNLTDKIQIFKDILNSYLSKEISHD